MVRVLAALGCALVGCSFSGPAATGNGGSDGGGDGDIDAAADDAAIDGPVVLGPFGTPRRLTEIEDALFGDELGDEYDDPSISDSGELLFASNDSAGTTDGGADVFRAQLSPGTSTFIDIERVDELSTPGFETTPFISADGLTALVASGGDLFISTRMSEGDNWGTLSAIPEATNNVINSANTEGYGQLSADGERLYFNSDRDGDLDLFVATLDGANGFDNVTKLAVSEVGRSELTPRVSDDELTLYFGAVNGGADLDLYTATRSSIAEDFGPAELVTELNTNSRDNDLAVSSSHRIAVFASDREGAGSFRLFISTR